MTITAIYNNESDHSGLDNTEASHSGLENARNVFLKDYLDHERNKQAHGRIGNFVLLFVLFSILCLFIYLEVALRYEVDMITTNIMNLNSIDVIHSITNCTRWYYENDPLYDVNCIVDRKFDQEYLMTFYVILPYITGCSMMIILLILMILSIFVELGYVCIISFTLACVLYLLSPPILRDLILYLSFLPKRKWKLQSNDSISSRRSCKSISSVSSSNNVPIFSYTPGDIFPVFFSSFEVNAMRRNPNIDILDMMNEEIYETTTQYESESEESFFDDNDYLSQFDDDDGSLIFDLELQMDCSGLSTPPIKKKNHDEIYKNINEVLYHSRKIRSIPKKYAPKSFKRCDIKSWNISDTIEYKKKIKNENRFVMHTQMESVNSWFNLRPTVDVGVSPDTKDIVNDIIGAIRQGIDINHKIPIFEELKVSVMSMFNEEHTRVYAMGIMTTLLKLIASVKDWPVIGNLIFLFETLAGFLIVDEKLKAYYLAFIAASQYLISSFELGVKAGHELYNIGYNRGCNEMHDAFCMHEQMSPSFMIDSFAMPITAWMYYLAFNSECKGDFIQTVTKKCFEVSKYSKGINGAIQFLLDSSKTLMQYFRHFTLGEALGGGLFPELDELVKRVAEQVDLFRNGADYNWDNANVLFQIERDLNTQIAKIPNAQDFIGYKHQALQLLSTIKPFIAKMQRSNINNNGCRVETLGSLLIGPPGVGKSVLLPALIGRIGSLTLNDTKLESFRKNHHDHIYAADPRKGFHDGFHGQSFTVIDEFGASVDSSANPNEDFRFVLKAINVWMYNLDMAHLEDKGVTNYNSDWLICTSNMTHLMIKSLIEPAAIARRFRLCFLVTPIPEFCEDPKAEPWNRKLDEEKMINRRLDDFSHLEFHPYNISTGDICGSAKSFDEYVDHCCTVYMQRKDFHERLLSSHKVYIEKCINTERQAFRNRFVVQSGKVIPESMMKLTDDIKDVCNKWLNYAKDNKIILSLCSALPILYMISSFLKAPFSEQSTFAKANVKTSSKAGRRRSASTISLNPQLCCANTNFDDVVTSVISNNHYRIYSNYGTRGYFTFLKGRVGMMPNHFFSKWSEIEEEKGNLVITFEKVLQPESKFQINFSDLIDHCYQIDDKGDLTLVYVPNTHMHKDITKFLVSEDMPMLSTVFHGALVRFTETLDSKRIMKVQTTPLKIVGEFKYSYYTNNRNYVYDIATTIGECGSLLFSADSTMKQVRLLGFHVAGDGTIGSSMAVFIENITKFFDIVQPEHIDVPLKVTHIDTSKIEVQMATFGQRFTITDRVDRLNVPTENNIIKTPLYNKWGETQNTPTILYSVNGVDPWLNSRANYSGESKAVDLQLLNACTRSYINQTFLNSIHKNTPWKPRIFSFEESIAGIEGEFKSIPRKTSPGYPWCLKNPGNGKKDFFGDGDKFDFNNPTCELLHKQVQEHIRNMLSNKRCKFLYADFLKAERRKIEKVKAGKVRLFSASPIDLLVLVRMYFGDFCRWIQQNRVHNGIAVGVNPFGVEWDVIAKLLQSIGDNMIFGDFSHYDASLFLAIMYEVLKVVEAFYSNSTPEERQIRRILFEEVVNSVHVATFSSDKQFSYEYEWIGSNPSGNPLTVIINSICNLILIRYCVCIIKYKVIEKPELRYPDFLPDFEMIERNILAITYGDDNGISVGDELTDVINQSTMTKAMAHIGMVYTSEDKSDNVFTHRPLEECTFLKCHFRYDKSINRYVAPQELNSILDMPYWTTKNNKEPLSVENTVQLLLDKLSLWGPLVFNSKKDAILQAAAQEIHYHPVRQDYNSCFNYILNYEAFFC